MEMEDTNTLVLRFAAGILAIALLAGLSIGISSLIWAWRNPEEEKKLIEAKRLHFAATTLTGLALLFALAMAMFYWDSAKGSGKEIFESCKTIIPPVVTLVLGYYFGRENRGDSTPGARSTPGQSKPPDATAA
jgi:hypothetical protein